MRIVNSIATAYNSIRIYGLRSMYLRNLIIVLIFTLIPILLLIIVSMNTINDFTKSEINRFYQEKTNQVCEALDDELDLLSGISQNISRSAALSSLIKLTDINPIKNYDIHLNMEYMYSIINNYLASYTEIDKIICRLDQSQKLLTGSKENGCTLSAPEDEQFEKIMNDIMSKQSKNVEYWTWLDEEKGSYFLTVACRAPINSMDNKNMIFLTADINEIYDGISSYESLYLQGVIIFDAGTGHVVGNNYNNLSEFFDGNYDLDEKIKGQSGTFYASEDNQKTIIVYSRSQPSNLVVGTKINLDNYYASSNKGRNSFIIAAVLSAFIAALLSVVGTSRFSEPISIMSEIIKHPEEWLEEKDISKVGFLEVQYVTRNLLETYQKNTQMEKLLVKRLERLRSAQINALQSQINPHFLFNTLDSINWSVREEMGLKSNSSMLIDSLSTFLRYSLESNEHLVAVDKEISHAKAYVDIQLSRYDYRFEVLWEIDESVLSERIVKITLQPLIENAIGHGIMQIDEKGIIRVILKNKKVKSLFVSVTTEKVLLKRKFKNTIIVLIMI